MKLFIILFAIVATAAAQRPTYAGLTPKGYPELASRFRDPADDQENINNAPSVVNRVGEDDTQASLNLPTDARGNVELVNRLNSWPQENKPFWLINAEHIERLRHPNEDFIQQQQNVNTVQQPELDEQNFGQDEQTNIFFAEQPLLDQQNLGQSEQTNVDIVQPPVLSQQNLGQNKQTQSRFGEPVATETRTIKPPSQRGSFAGERS